MLVAAWLRGPNACLLLHGCVDLTHACCRLEPWLRAGQYGYSVLMHMIQSRGGPGYLAWYSEHMRDLLCIITMQLLVRPGSIQPPCAVFLSCKSGTFTREDFPCLHNGCITCPTTQLEFD